MKTFTHFLKDDIKVKINIGDTVITNILEDLNVDIDALRGIVYDNISQEGDAPVSIDDIVYTPRVEKIWNSLEVLKESLPKRELANFDAQYSKIHGYTI